jgi:hypothetical protein
MATIKVFNNDEDRMETYYREEWEAMPYNTGNTLLVREFRGSSRSSLLWTTKRAMQSWNSFRKLWGSSIYVGYAFKRPYEGGHSPQSQHYAGVSFDVAQNLNNTQRASMRSLAVNSGLWTYVEPVSISPTWVHFDKRFGTPACSAGYPVVKSGSVSTYVLICQDCLNFLGYSTGGIDGIFGNGTTNAVKAYQRSRGLAADGIVGCATWTALTNDAVGDDPVAGYGEPSD